ncbi:MAG: ABC transporter permease subunit [Alkalispirochaeta sp.]
MPQIMQSWAILLLVALGGLVSERGGILNIGLEGMITAGAFTAIAAVRLGAAVPAAVLVGAGSAMVLGLLFAQFALRWNANPFIVGLALNVLAAGAAPLLSEILFGTRGSVRLEDGGIAAIPVILIAVVVLITVHLGVYHSVPGLRLRIAGEQGEWLRAQGVGVKRYQLLGLLGSGALAGTGGALLALRLGVYLPSISSGRGWIALVIVYLGYRTPIGLAVAALFFGTIDAMAVRAQSVLGVPPTILLALPYLLTVVAFVSYAALRRRA